GRHRPPGTWRASQRTGAPGAWIDGRARPGVGCVAAGRGRWRRGAWSPPGRDKAGADESAYPADKTDCRDIPNGNQKAMQGNGDGHNQRAAASTARARAGVMPPAGAAATKMPTAVSITGSSTWAAARIVLSTSGRFRPAAADC